MRIQLNVLLALGTVGVLGAAAPLSAQVSPATPGIQFAGCWTTGEAFSSQGVTCVVPEGANGLRLNTVARDGAVTESTLQLTGERTPVSAEGCTGWEQARLTGDGERIIVDAEIACAGGPQQKVQTAFSITPAGYFLQTTGTGFNMIPNASLRLYMPLETYLQVPVATRNAVMPYLAEAERARMRLRDNALAARDVIELEEMGVAAPLIDVVVASSYPKSFVIDATGSVANAQMPQGNVSSYDRSSAMMNPFLFMNGYPMLSMYDWDMMYACSRFSAGCPIGYNGYSRYGYGGIYGGAYGGFWPGYGGPVIVRPVVTGPSGSGSSGGRAVRGRGYTQSGNENSGTAQPRGSVGTATVRGGGSSGGSSAGSSSGSSSGGGARTAKPRSP